MLRRLYPHVDTAHCHGPSGLGLALRLGLVRPRAANGPPVRVRPRAANGPPVEREALGTAWRALTVTVTVTLTLTRLYPHVELWGELVESTNSRQREERVDRNNKMREKHAALASAR